MLFTSETHFFWHLAEKKTSLVPQELRKRQASPPQEQGLNGELPLAGSVGIKAPALLFEGRGRYLTEGIKKLLPEALLRCGMHIPQKFPASVGKQSPLTG